MRVLRLLFCVISLFAIIPISIMIELQSFGGTFDELYSIYRKDINFNFFLNLDSSFYSIYSFSNNGYLMIRKLGHFVGFGFLAAITFIMIPVKDLWSKGLIAVSSTILVGVIDEMHQHFLVNRSGRLLDVGINTAGILTSVAALITLYYVKRRIKGGQKEEKIVQYSL